MPTGSRPGLPAQVVRVAVEGNVGGQPWANIFHVKTDLPGITSAQGVTDLLTAFNQKMIDSGLWQFCSTTTHVTQLSGVVQTTPDTAHKSQIASTITGITAGTVLPAEASLVLSWLSEVFWRGGKPRTYIPGMVSTYADTNHSWLDSQKAILLAKAELLRSGINSITTAAIDQCTMGMVSYASGKEWRPVPLFFPFTGVTIHDRIGTQRRRLGPWLR